MPSLLVRNLPDQLYEALRRQAKRNGRSLSAEVIAILREELARPHLTRDEIRRRIEARRRVWGTLDRPAAEYIREDREGGHGEGF